RTRAPRGRPRPAAADGAAARAGRFRARRPRAPPSPRAGPARRSRTRRALHGPAASPPASRRAATRRRAGACVDRRLRSRQQVLGLQESPDGGEELRVALAGVDVATADLDEL